MGRKESDQYIRELCIRVAESEKMAKGAALQIIIDEEVGNELDRRFDQAVETSGKNTINAVLVSEYGSRCDATQRTAYRLGLTVNGHALEAVVTLPGESVFSKNRDTVMVALRSSLAEQIAELLLAPMQFSFKKG